MQTPVCRGADDPHERLPLPDNSGHNRTKIRHGRFIAAPAAAAALPLRVRRDVKRKPFLGVEGELGGWAWVDAATQNPLVAQRFEHVARGSTEPGVSSRPAPASKHA